MAAVDVSLLVVSDQWINLKFMCVGQLIPSHSLLSYWFQNTILIPVLLVRDSVFTKYIFVAKTHGMVVCLAQSESLLATKAPLTSCWDICCWIMKASATCCTSLGNNEQMCMWLWAVQYQLVLTDKIRSIDAGKDLTAT